MQKKSFNTNTLIYCNIEVDKIWPYSLHFYYTCSEFHTPALLFPPCTLINFNEIWQPALLFLPALLFGSG